MIRFRKAAWYSIRSSVQIRPSAGSFRSPVHFWDSDCWFILQCVDLFLWSIAIPWEQKEVPLRNLSVFSVTPFAGAYPEVPILSGIRVFAKNLIFELSIICLRLNFSGALIKAPIILFMDGHGYDFLANGSCCFGASVSKTSVSGPKHKAGSSPAGQSEESAWPDGRNGWMSLHRVNATACAAAQRWLRTPWLVPFFIPPKSMLNCPCDRTTCRFYRQALKFGD